MVQCPKCSAQNLPDSRFCSSCAQPLSTPSQMPTMGAPEAGSPKPAETPHVSRIISSDSIPAGGFTPGTILADRYRIIGLLGRGGMGEVYRADDLKLGQPVALKFLPTKLADDPVRRERFFAEVRITRQLSHPNITRVYDIGEIDGRHFLSMEFIDGEDLASLLKRIGHLTNEKALDIARQLAAGLAAAHERGVLHRDLKPANIMLDGHGRVRITDFGLAIAVEDESQTAEIAGTPAYMAPEQLAGKGATVRSDMYSLGLVLYEIYTGKKAFTATNLAELRQQKETHTPRAISELREGMDPVVERLIRRCMERDPNARPSSVSQLALALPGGDPLAAALAAGETPSPEMVAASGSQESFGPAVAWGLLAFVIVGTLAILWMNDRFTLLGRVSSNKPPDALVELSRQFLKKVGYGTDFADSTYGFMANSELLRYREATDQTPGRWKNLRANALLFWYRQSPQRLRPNDDFTEQGSPGRISPSNPPLRHPGEALVMLDAEGRLVSFSAIPPDRPYVEGKAQEAQWGDFFSAAGLDSSKWKLADPPSGPQPYADTRTAWESLLKDAPDTPVRIEAAAWQATPVAYQILDKWAPAMRKEPAPLTITDRIRAIATGLLVIPALLGGLFFARRNMRLGRGDRHNANRLALIALALAALVWVLRIPQFSFTDLLLSPYAAGFIWIFYMAIEPFVRRRWPHILVSWTRLFSGQWRDPLVARDALIACAFGVGVMFVSGFFHNWLPSWFGYPELNGPAFPLPASESMLGGRFFISMLFDRIINAAETSMLVICLLVIARALLRNQKAAVALCILVWALANSYGSHWSLAVVLIMSALWFGVLIRFGLLAVTLGYYVSILVDKFPATLDTSAWYSGYGYAALAILGVIVLYALRYSLGGRPLLAASPFDE